MAGANANVLQADSKYYSHQRGVVGKTSAEVLAPSSPTVIVPAESMAAMPPGTTTALSNADVDDAFVQGVLCA